LGAEEAKTGLLAHEKASKPHTKINPRGARRGIEVQGVEDREV
jgi:hypothetical protein